MATSTPTAGGRAGSFAASDTQSSGQGPGGPHLRTYQACIPCRKRKVRCDLGPVDSPHDPPCTRCRRESKECFFSATRRKKRAADAGEGVDLIEEEDVEVRGGRKRLREEEPNITQDAVPLGYSAFPLTPGGSTRQQVPLHPPPTARDSNDEELKEQENHTVGTLTHGEIHGGHDALNMLVEAALPNHRTNSMTGARPTLSASGFSPATLPSVSSPMMHTRPNRQHRMSLGQHIDPVQNLADMQEPMADPTTIDMNEALKNWSRFRFVRAGWFTAREGFDYVQYFYEKICPLTPIALPDYRTPSGQVTLLSEEPMLVVTILTISSRHKQLSGTGTTSRQHAIHQRLWTYLEGMINRFVWGQEQFGGGICGAGSQQPGCDVNPYARKGLRTLGTVESLMLLTEWHPRSMHFPPEENDAELLITEESLYPPGLDDPKNDTIKGIGGQRIDTWLEPCWRSDRICWTLLSMALSLAFEIGVFDKDTTRHVTEDPVISPERRVQFEERRGHVKNLLSVYMTQTSGRLGLTSMLPQLYSEPGVSDLYGKRPTPRNMSSKDTCIYFWLHIASIMKRGNAELFQNRQYTREIISSGHYKTLLQTFHPQLTKWRQDFDASTQITPLMRSILTIEFEYCRVYINSLSLQAVVERCTKNTPKQAPADKADVMHGNAIPPDVLEKWYGDDRYYINEVIDGSRKLLEVVVEGLFRGNHLRHCPVRTCFRIISVAIILLKTFALGATEHDVTISLRYLDRTIEALRSCIVDDVHVASRFADLLETLTARIKSRLVRMATRNGSSGVSRHESPLDHSFRLSSAAPQSNGRIDNSEPPSQTYPQYNGATSMPPFESGRATPADPLYGISTQTYDFGDISNSFSIMPPPTNMAGGGTSDLTFDNLGNNQNGFMSNNGYGDDGGLGDSDWFALPLDPLMNNAFGAEVTNTGYGPGLGGLDMLDFYQ